MCTDYTREVLVHILNEIDIEKNISEKLIYLYTYRQTIRFS